MVTKLKKPNCNVRTVTQKSVTMTKQSEIQRMFKELIERMENLKKRQSSNDKLCEKAEKIEWSPACKDAFHILKQ